MSDRNSPISFTKMQAAGNDFVVVDNRAQELTEQEIVALAPKICDRRFGVGSDGILVLMPPQHDGVNYTMFFRNPDGSDAGMCGNGARCLAQYAHSTGFGSRLRFNVHDLIYEAEVTDQTVRISFPIEASAKKLEVEGQTVYSINTGTEHIVTEVDSRTIENIDFLKTQGRMLREHPVFQPKGTNVNFIFGMDESSLKLQTYERGVEDLTMACGTGAVASALCWDQLKNHQNKKGKCEVETQGGTLLVYFYFDREAQTYSNIKLEGPAHFVFKGEYTL